MPKSAAKPVDTLIDKMRKTYGKSIPNVMEAGRIKRLALTSPRLNYAFGGGFPISRMAEFFGPESGGKTVLASYIGGEFQRRKDGGPNRVLFIDMEHTFDINYAMTVGLNPDESQFIFVQPLHGDEGFTIAQAFIETGEFGLIIWDSIAATPTEAAVIDEYGKASFGGTAKLFAEGLKKFNPYLSRFETSLILTNQVRANIGVPMGHGNPEKTTGGYAPKFYASWRGRVSRGDDIQDGSETIGNIIKVKNVKSKVGYPKRSAELRLLYGSGFNPEAEYVDFIDMLGLIHREPKSTWFKYEGKSVAQGKTQLLNWLRENPSLFEGLKEQVNETFAHHSALDDQEIIDEEAEQEVAVLDSVEE